MPAPPVAPGAQASGQPSGHKRVCGSCGTAGHVTWVSAACKNHGQWLERQKSKRMHKTSGGIRGGGGGERLPTGAGGLAKPKKSNKSAKHRSFVGLVQPSVVPLPTNFSPDAPKRIRRDDTRPPAKRKAQIGKKNWKKTVVQRLVYFSEMIRVMTSTM